MPSQNLYNFAPMLQILLLGALLTGLVVFWVWRRHAGRGRQRLRMALTVLTLFLTFDLILVGAFTRLTDSGLGCPDWPGCYGFTSPAGAHAPIAEAQAAMPTGPVTHQKAWIEMLHRYLATAVGGLILLQALWAMKDRLAGPHEKDTEGAADISLWWTWTTLLWVLIQGLFGALTVTMKLFPAIVTLHLLGAYALLALLVLQLVVRRSLQGKVMEKQDAAEVLGGPQRRLVWAGLLVLLMQACAGAWVSTNYAVLACSDFPTCQGVWWPSMDFAAGMEMWRPLGETAAGETLSFQALTGIHMLHRLIALLAFATLGAVVYALHRAQVFQIQGRCLLGLLVLQFFTGLSNVVLGWPMFAAILHTAGAGAMVAVLTWLLGESAAAAKVLQIRGRSV
jgi:heme a synthase